MSDAEVVAPQLFDRYASDYGRTVNAAVRYSGRDLAFFTEAKVHQLTRIGSHLRRPLAESELLDVGCGIGGLDRLLMPRVGRLVGVDTSEGMLDAAAHLNPGAEYLHYAGSKLPFDDRTFDLTFAVCVVHHVDPTRWESFLAEMWRVTRPGGAAVVIEHNPLNPLTRRSVSTCEFDEDAVLTGPGPLVRTFRRLGAARVRSRYFLFSPFGGRRVQAAERRLLGRLPVGAQYIVEANRVPIS